MSNVVKVSYLKRRQYCSSEAARLRFLFLDFDVKLLRQMRSANPTWPAVTLLASRRARAFKGNTQRPKAKHMPIENIYESLIPAMASSRLRFKKGSMPGGWVSFLFV